MSGTKYDVIIAGAGPAGISAALEASRSGCRVALLERYGCVGGNLTMGHVGPLMGTVCPGTIGEKIEHAICPVYDLCPDFELAKIRLTELLDEAGVDVYLQTAVVNAEKEGDALRRIHTDGKFGKQSFEAPLFIDATGDGDLATLSGCPWESGREGDGLVQPVSIMFVISGVDENQTLVCQHEEHYTDLGDGREYLDLCHQACRTGELPPTVNIVRLYRTAYPDERMVNATQANRIDPLDSEAVFRAEADLRRQMLQIMTFLKKNIPGFENIRIKSSSSTLGVRETRRILGDHVLVGEELLSGKKFADAVVHNASFPLDIHNPSGPGQSTEEEKCPPRVQPYDIPYSAMRPLGVSNLLTAGRCISGTHEAMSSYRVMRICMAMGQAAGAAAALMKANGCFDTRKLDAGLIREHLKMRGVELDK